MQINLVDLVIEARKEFYDRAISDYEDIFSSEMPDSATDEYSNAIRFYQSLNKDDRSMAFQLARQVLCETVANVFAWLDGAYFLENQSKILELKFEGEEKNLNTYLHDIWIAIEQGADIDELRKFYSQL